MSYAPVSASDVLTSTVTRLKRHKLVMLVLNIAAVVMLTGFCWDLWPNYTLILTRQTFHGSVTVTVELANIYWTGLGIASFSISCVIYGVFFGLYDKYITDVKQTEGVCVRPIVWIETALCGTLAFPVVLQMNLASDIMTLLPMTIVWAASCMCLFFQERSNVRSDSAPYMLITSAALKVITWISIIYWYIQSQSLTFVYATAIAFTWLAFDAFQLLIGILDHVTSTEPEGNLSFPRKDNPVPAVYIYTILSFLMRLITFLLPFVAAKTGNWFELAA